MRERPGRGETLRLVKRLPVITVAYKETKSPIKGLVAAWQERDNNDLDNVSHKGG